MIWKTHRKTPNILIPITGKVPHFSKISSPRCFAYESVRIFIVVKIYILETRGCSWPWEKGNENRFWKGEKDRTVLPSQEGETALNTKQRSVSPFLGWDRGVKTRIAQLQTKGVGGSTSWYTSEDGDSEKVGTGLYNHTSAFINSSKGQRKDTMC